MEGRKERNWRRTEKREKRTNLVCQQGQFIILGSIVIIEYFSFLGNGRSRNSIDVHVYRRFCYIVRRRFTDGRKRSPMARGTTTTRNTKMSFHKFVTECETIFLYRMLGLMHVRNERNQPDDPGKIKERASKTYQLIDWPSIGPFDQQVCHSARYFLTYKITITPHQTIKQQPIYQSSKQASNRPTNRPTDQPNKQPTNKPTNQSTNQPTNQHTSQLLNQQTKLTINYFIATKSTN